MCDDHTAASQAASGGATPIGQAPRSAGPPGAGDATDRSDPKGRLGLLGDHAEVFAEKVPQVVAVAPEGVLVVVAVPRGSTAAGFPQPCENP
jgi:hypothetical protein